MRVLVWESYGNTDIYLMETEDQFNNIKNNVIEMSSKYYQEVPFNKCTNIKQLVRLVQEHCVVSNDDSYEKFELSELIE